MMYGCFGFKKRTRMNSHGDRAKAHSDQVFTHFDPLPPKEFNPRIDISSQGFDGTSSMHTWRTMGLRYYVRVVCWGKIVAKVVYYPGEQLDGSVTALVSYYDIQRVR